MQYVFYGSFSDIGGLGRYVGRQFGQVIEIPQDVAERAVTEGASILPIAEADKIGFDPAQLATYYAIPMQSNAPAEFLAKRAAAWMAIHNWREQLLAAKAAPVEPENNPAPQVPSAPAEGPVEPEHAAIVPETSEVK